MVDNGNASICGTVTIVTNFPPADWSCTFAICSTCDAFLVPDGAVLPAMPKHLGSKHVADLVTSTIPPLHVRRRDLCQSQEFGAVLEGRPTCEGKGVQLVLRGGQAAAGCARFISVAKSVARKAVQSRLWWALASCWQAQFNCWSGSHSVHRRQIRNRWGHNYSSCECATLLRD